MTQDQLLPEMVKRIRQEVEPLRVLLFGSRARGGNRPNSDFDLLVIAPSNLPRWKRTVGLYQRLSGLGVAKDIVWWTPEEIEEWKGVKNHFITTAMREGQVLYEKPA